MKPVLKAPGAKRLKLKYGEALSSSAVHFVLRRYTSGQDLLRSVLARRQNLPESPQGTVVLVDSIKFRLESACGFSASN